MAEYELKVVKRETAATEAAERQVAATEAAEREVAATEAAERDAVRSEVKAAESTELRNHAGRNQPPYDAESTKNLQASSAWSDGARQVQQEENISVALGCTKLMNYYNCDGPLRNNPHQHGKKSNLRANLMHLRCSAQNNNHQC